ncbi:regulator of Vps4 activity in the MVB pathway-domain-containing protein [Cryomyces antarcticus]|uniref:Vacuolar protein sorting-associated protein ist1 n=1 Tax=Cryomyces antarcticus TaxID=329879 RepID=A0ABR0LZ74_9PEZI|nr:Vacuolar protein sorting-associated protein ist1 [Cryomyces antarcticus]KAK5257034.1 Vacuolar protein sorting-associated protein ist1 [Cryomyces antarcticus]
MAPSSTLISKLKVQLKLSISRLRMTQQKDSAIAKQQRRAMAQLLEQGKDESAHIRVENIIRSDLTTELLEILELYCELLLARAGLLEAKDCDPGLAEAVHSLIYAAPRTEVKELQAVRALLAEKYGKEVALRAAENKDGLVAKRVLAKLRVEPPDERLVEEYLRTIADVYGIQWPKTAKGAAAADDEGEGDAAGDNDDDAPSGGQKIPKKSLEAPLSTDELSRATPPTDLGPRSPVSVAPPKPTSDNMTPTVKLPPAPLDLKPGVKMKKAEVKTSTNGAADKGKAGGPGGKIPDVDELAKRFAELKR